MRLDKYVLGAVFAVVLAVMFPFGAHASGMWWNWPGIGFSSYCASNVTGSTGPSGITGQAQGLGTGILCAQTVPAGPTVFTGNEYLPVDLGPLGGSTSIPIAESVVQLTQFGVGPMVDVTSPASATIAANTPFYFLDGAQGSAFTVTMPAAPLEGQIQRVICEAATVGVLTVSANTGQTLKGNPAAACVAGVGYAWRYQASNTTWYRIQ